MKRLILAAAATAAFSALAPVAMAEGLKITGSVGAAVSATDNVYATAGNEIDDVVASFSGAVDFDNEGEAGAFGASLAASADHYFEEDDESDASFDIGLRGKLKFGADANISFGAGHGLHHEDRKARVARRDTVKRSEYTTDSAYVGFQAPLGAVKLSGKAAVDVLDYENGKLRGSNTAVLQDDRDRTTDVESLRADFAPDADVSFYAKVVRTGVEYDLKPPASLHNRDSETVWVGAGASFNGLPNLKGEIEAAWQQRQFDQAGFDDISTWGAGADLTWTPAEGATLHGYATRIIEESTVPGSPGYVATTLGASFNQSFGGIWAFKLSAQHEWDDHRQVDREDDVSEYGIGLAATLKDGLTANLDYTLTSEDSDGALASPGYDVGLIAASINLAF